MLRLDHPARIHQIQLLSHEYKIATKIELYTGLLPPGETSLDRAVMRRLGHLSFDPNTASGHQARELKSVHVNVDAAILRVVIHKCHVNKLNIYNQVGVVALNVIGEPISPMDGGLGGGQYDGLAPGPRPSRLAGVSDLSLDFDVDPVTAQKIREIHALKEDAVAREDYDEAKRLRDGINRLKAVGAKVAQLEQRKRSAIEAEDYDAAKVIKMEIDKLREAGGVVAVGESVGAGSGAALHAGARNGGPERIFNRALEANTADGSAHPGRTSVDAAVEAPPSPAHSHRSGRHPVVEDYQAAEYPPSVADAPAPERAPPPPSSFEDHASLAARRRSEFEAHMRGGLSPAQLAKIRDEAGPDDIPPMAGAPGAPSGFSYDERPAVSKAAMHEAAGDLASTPQRFRDLSSDPSAQGGNNDEVPAGATGRSRFPPGAEDELGSGGGTGTTPASPGSGARNAEAPEGFNADLPPPEPISSSLATEAAPIVEAFGEYVAMCLYSKNWMHREAALVKMESETARGAVRSANDREVFRAVCVVLGRLFKDKVANVFAASCKLLAQATRQMGPSVGAREVHSGVAQLAPQLLEKLGDAHAKVRDAAREAVVELARSELSLVAGPLVKPVRSQSAWRVVLGRLGIMLELIPLHGLAKPGDHGGLTLDAVMEFTAKTFESPNGEVRSTAVKVTLECCAIAGRAVEKFLPKNLKPAIRDIIDEGLGIKTNGAGGRGGTASKQDNVAAAMGAAKPRQSAGSKPPATPPDRRGGGGGGGGGGGYRAPPPEGNSTGAPTARELKAEIAAREKELGKQHPDVAVALTDLAALHSEEESFAAAQPLYERALRIQEKTLGAEHQDTVQTLTDLAICHLDQGHNDVGRPLLERALVLQREALGDDHADVVAIRDVLQSLDADDQ